jgi:hypothetical protein
MSEKIQRYYALKERPLEVIDLSLVTYIDEPAAGNSYVCINTEGAPYKIISLESEEQAKRVHAEITAALAAFRAQPPELPAAVAPVENAQLAVPQFTVTEITVGASTSFNHPHEDYANFKPSVTLKAQIRGGDFDLITMQLQHDAHAMVLREKQRILAELQREEEISNLRSRLDDYRGCAEHTRERLAEETDPSTADSLRLQLAGYEKNIANQIEKLKSLGAWPEESPAPSAVEPAAASVPVAPSIDPAGERRAPF